MNLVYFLSSNIYKITSKQSYMDISSLGNVSRITSINNKVEVRHLKVKQHLRTYVSGLENFMNNDEKDQFVLTLKKKLGAGMEIKETETGKEYGFQGDHKDRIKQLIIESQKVKKEEII